MREPEDNTLAENKRHAKGTAYTLWDACVVHIHFAVRYSIQVLGAVVHQFYLFDSVVPHLQILDDNRPESFGFAALHIAYSRGLNVAEYYENRQLRSYGMNASH